jgi:hypothetical protein
MIFLLVVVDQNLIKQQDNHLLLMIFLLVEIKLEEDIVQVDQLNYY